MKRLLREANEETEKLRKENNTLKKTLKYTKMSELNVQNEALGEEC